jgi:flagellar secretion chaperone FliS
MATPKMYDNYATATVNTTDQGKLILICYDVAIKSCTLAKEMIEQNQLQDKAKRIYKAQDAITELMVSLNTEKGGTFAKRLFALYDYFNWRLSEANIKQSVPMVEEVLRHLKSLRDAWVIAIEKVRKEKAGILATPEKAGALKLVG